MNKKLIAVALLAASAFAGVANAADGTIKFTGSLTDTTCTIDAGSADQTVDLGKVGTNAFGAVGTSAGGTPFSIKFSACPAATQASVKFDGAVSSDNPQLLGLTTATGVATGVGIGVFEQNSETLIPIGSPSATQPVEAGSTFNFVAKYVATSATTTAGPANSTTDFTVVYN